MDLYLQYLNEDILVYENLPLFDEQSLDNLKCVFFSNFLINDRTFKILIDINYKNVNIDLTVGESLEDKYRYLLNCNIYKYNKYLFDIGLRDNINIDKLMIKYIIVQS